jgi:hypothetical protein
MSARSRYAGTPVATVVVHDDDGRDREVAYLLTRVPADPATTATLDWHRVVPGDRLDLLATRHLGDPAAAWRIADANLALDPDALVAPDAAGRVVVIPVPGV